MLARRFTIVCLLCAVFAVLFADLVGRQHLGTGGMVIPCKRSQGIACTPLAMRSSMPFRRF